MMTSINIKPHTALYHAYMEDIMELNGQRFQNRINRIISLEVDQKDNISFLYKIEMFRYKQTNNYMELTEKDFWNELAYIYDNVQFTANDRGKVLSMNKEYCETLHSKRAKIVEELKESYKGKAVNDILDRINNVEEDFSDFVDQLLHYKMYGLFFTGLYSQIRAQSRKKKMENIFGNKHLLLEESFIPKETKDEQGERYVSYDVKGQIIDFCLGDWTQEANNLNLEISENQQPEFNRYNGAIEINALTSTLENAEVNISLSYGSGYKRMQTFSLLLMNEDDINDLF